MEGVSGNRSPRRFGQLPHLIVPEDFDAPITNTDISDAHDGGDAQAEDAAAVAEAAAGLAGGDVHPFTRDLIAQMARGEISGDQAAAAVVGRFVNGDQPRLTTKDLDRAAAGRQRPR
ncbi:hypothetical protein K7Z54_23470 [Mycobacterium avium subsp. hominissuis]|uniref:hypothetical protein n=1 Tax=Mycobacterium avium TaxID=1764 RepID=UPI00293A07A3|nr:hypothetical protein [Mycobacterium avium]MDV3276626.1 hypothetical protein [Mycobacterium avium subsp. hominissuis]